MSDKQIVLYTSYLHIIGGIETFVLNFLELMSDYSITVYCPKLPDEMAELIKKRANLIQYGSVSCNTLIMVRMMDAIPSDILYQKSYRMCHACKSNPTWKIIPDCDGIIHVSEASKQSFLSDGDVIYNPLLKTSKKAILLVSATRIPALDKGKNAERMLTLARMLNSANIDFLWFNFSDAPLQNAPKGFVNIGTFHNLQPYIAKADYLVQLSDQEGFGYSVLEALENNTAVICTPFSTTKELGVIDGQNGYIVPFDMNFDVKKLLGVPTFTYRWDNVAIKKKWSKLFNSKPKPKEYVLTEALVNYRDLVLDRMVRKGEILRMLKSRAEYIAEKGLIKIREV